MRKQLLWLLCIVAILVSIGSIIIGVVGQDVVTWKNVSIQEFEFKGKINCVLFIDTSDNMKLECKITKEQKDYLVDTLKENVDKLVLKLEKQ